MLIKIKQETMAYNQPKNTPMHGVAMYQRRDGGSMYESNKGPNMYDDTGAYMGEAAADLEYNPTDDRANAAPNMVDTYDSNSGASEPITALLIKAAALAKKAAASKAGIAAAKAVKSKAAKAAMSSAASSAAGQLASRATSKKDEGIPGPDAKPTGSYSSRSSGGGYESGGVAMGPSKGIDFGKMFQNIGSKVKNIDLKGKLQRKPKATLPYSVRKDHVSKLGMAGAILDQKFQNFKANPKAAVDRFTNKAKSVASSPLGKTAIESATASAAGNLAARITSKKDDEVEDAQIAYSPGGNMGNYGGGGYAYGGASMIPKMASQDSSYIDKRQGDKKAVMEGLMKRQLPISVGNFQFDFRNAIRMKELADQTKQLLKPDTSRSSRVQPISPSSVAPTKVSAYTAKQDSIIKSLGSYQ